MRQILRQLCKYPVRKEASQFELLDFRLNGIDQEKFVDYLKYEKRFLKAWLSTVEDIKTAYFKKITQVTKKRMQRYVENENRIISLLESCRKREYLELLPNKLKITEEGRRFSHGWITFVNECLKKYNTIGIFFVGILGSAILGNLLKSFWEWLINYKF